MPLLTLMVGPPGSGKTSWAKLRSGVRVSQDDEGKGHMGTFWKALLAGEDIIVDRMNFDKKQRARFIGPAKEKGYEVQIRVSYVPYKVCLDRCKAREGHPTVKTSEDAISALNTFFRFFEYPTKDEGVVVEDRYVVEQKTKAIIVDLDGTLTDCEHRRHYVHPPEGCKKNWMGFFEECINDTLNWPIYELVCTFMADKEYEIVLCSGRPREHCKKLTEEWLLRHLERNDFALYMRPPGDSRQDSLIKEIILDFELLPRYNILFTLDDRQQVVDMWRRRGLTCLQCAKGDF